MILGLFRALGLKAQEIEEVPFTVVSFNVENLFDTIRNPQREDGEFTPSGCKKWDSRRYYKKIDRLSKAISQAGGHHWAWLVALQEIENETVLESLTHSPTLVSANYRYIISKGNDPRGINVALLYAEGLFSPTYAVQWGIPPVPQEPFPASRPILCVEGKLLGQQPLMVFVVHLPSARKGQRVSAPLRKAAVNMLKQKCDSIRRQKPEMPILVLGDFNATPFSSETKDFAFLWRERDSAKKDAIRYMYDISINRSSKSMPGSYYFRRQYLQLDRMILSSHFFRRKEDSYLRYVEKTFTNCRLNGAMKELSRGLEIPRRTYGGNYYLGGPSDHLPIRASFILSFIKNNEAK